MNRVGMMKPQCFIVNCAKEIPTSLWHKALSTQLTDAELKSVTSYVFRRDQEKSLLSLLLQKYVIRNFLSTVLSQAKTSLATSPLEQQVEPHSPKDETSFRIERTREKKPYLKVTAQPLEALVTATGGHFNYNVSHHGHFVGILAHTSVLVGIDIVDITSRATFVNSMTEYMDIYRKQLTDIEMASIFAKPSETASYTHFFVLWSLKEAYVKAIGVGIGVNLQEVEFEVEYFSDTDPATELANETETVFASADAARSCVSSTASSSPAGRGADVTAAAAAAVRGRADMRLRGKPATDWSFEFLSLDHGCACAHVMTVARGPLSAALDTYAAAAWSGMPAHTPSSSSSSSSSSSALHAYEISSPLSPPVLLTLDHLLVDS